MNKDLVNLLSLSNNEVKTFEYLKKFPQLQIADISKGTKIARMTLYPIIESLKKRGLIIAQRKGKRRFWSIIDSKDMSESIVNIATKLLDSQEVRLNIQHSGFAILHGEQAIDKVWKSLDSLPPYTRVLGIQPTSSLKQSLGKLPWHEKVKPIQQTILTKPIVIDGVISEDYYPSMINFYANDKHVQRMALESFLGRATDMTFVSKEFFKNTESELLILPNVAYLTDTKNEISIEIRNPIMLGFLRELFELAKGYGKKVNQNNYIEGLLQKI